MKTKWKNLILMTSGLLVIPSCSTVEEQGECLKWTTSVVQKKERLPYPMRGTVIREEAITLCVSRETKDETALVVRGPTIYI